LKAFGTSADRFVTPNVRSARPAHAA